MDKPQTSFKKFRLGQIRPEGWLKEQLRLEADALMGNLDKIKPSVKYSPYQTGEGPDASALPIWLEAFICMAWCLDDEDLKTRATSHLRAIENNCSVSGWLKNGDAWALICLIRCFDVYLSARDDEQTQNSLYSALKALDEYVDVNELTGKASFRWFEALPAIKRMYDATSEEWLTVLAKKLEYNGRDWLKFFGSDWLYKAKLPRPCAWSDAVNIAYAVKCGAVMYALYGDEKMLQTALDMVESLDESDGTVTGMFSGDPILAGQGSDRGYSAEAAAEYINSLIYLEEMSCSSALCDKIEKIIFNVISSMFSTDMWAYQRISMINQVSCTCADGKAYSDRTENAAAFGMADNDGSTAEVLAQAFPKFITGMYFQTDEGIALTSYAPGTLTAEIDNSTVTISCDSAYPFRDNATLSVTVDSPCSFELRLRIPKWAESVRITTDGGYISPVKSDYCVLDGTWTGTTVFSVSFKSEFSLTKLDKTAYALTKGPLVYSLALSQERRYISDSLLPYANYELHPVSEWAYAIVCDDKLPFSKQITYEEKERPCPMLSKSSAPTEVFVYAKAIEWGLQAGNAVPAPAAVCTSDKRELLRFVPYGSTNLRMTVFPVTNE